MMARDLCKRYLKTSSQKNLLSTNITVYLHDLHTIVLNNNMF